jgi:hypothetical protein
MRGNSFAACFGSVPGVERFGEKVENASGVGTGRDSTGHVDADFEG